ncbi:unnamed protein product [Protopolystoma xenopodis]|uniref:Uncharacterized protein n=1 Tax=Protopolystoma xenopodis TaxID=117903 RepID=A0A3S5AKU2_9PLAT|nr:unnamed protein product [Protopolystoma xenopodis]
MYSRPVLCTPTKHSQTHEPLVLHSPTAMRPRAAGPSQAVSGVDPTFGLATESGASESRKASAIRPVATVT